MASVLVVDDDEVVRDVVVRYSTGRASSRARQLTARRRAERSVSSPRLVILDVMLPEMNGLDVCRWVAQSARCRSSCSPRAARSPNRIIGLELGADDYVVKPFSPRELTERVKAVLRARRRPPHGSSRLEVAASSSTPRRVR